jgi:hypothetical protein
MAKVVVLSSVHPAFDHRIFHKECKTLARAGHEVVFVVPHEKSERIDGVTIHALPLPRDRWERMTRTTWTVLRSALKQRGDVYHFHDPELIFAGILLKMRGKRVVYDVHEDVPNDIIRAG